MNNEKIGNIKIKESSALPLCGVAMIIAIIGFFAIPNNIEDLFNTLILMSFSAFKDIDTYTYIILILFLFMAPFILVMIVRRDNSKYIDLKLGSSKEVTLLRIKIIKILELIGKITDKLSIAWFIITVIMNVSDWGIDWLWGTILYNQRTSVVLYMISYMAGIIMLILLPVSERVKEIFGEDSEEYKYIVKVDPDYKQEIDNGTKINFEFIKEEVTDEDLKKKLYELAKSEQKDLDGDLICYKNETYYVDTKASVVRMYREK